MAHTVERGELYAAIWREPATVVAARYGITSTALSKICRKLRVPTPPRGHWARKTAGQRVARTPLPKLVPGQKTVHVIEEPAPRPKAALAEALAAEKARPPIVVPDALDELHPLVRKYEARLRRRGEGSALWRKTECIAIDVSRGQLDRALRIMHALMTALDERSIAVEVSKPDERADGTIEPSATTVVVEGVRLAIGLEELTRWEQPEIKPSPPPDPTSLRGLSGPGAERAAQIAAQLRAGAAAAEARRLGRYVPTGRLRLWMDPHEYLRVTVQRQVRDTDNQRIEQRLNKFVAQLLAVADAVREERAHDEEQGRQRAEDERVRAEQERVRQRHERLRDDLARRVEAFRRADEIRALITAVEARSDLPPSAIAWLEWARGRADIVERSALEVELVWDRA